jgi:hypothetical protein
MANKELQVSLNSQISEVTTNKVLAAAGVKKNAATIVRDVNGKVISVMITLPESASEAARIAIAATPGVADIAISDLPVGTVGWDGTAAALENVIITENMILNNDSIIFTYNQNSTCTLTKTDPYATGVQLYSQDLSSAPPFDFAIECKISSMVDAFFSLGLEGAGTAYIQIRANIEAFNLTVATPMPVFAMPLVDPLVSHIYKLARVGFEYLIYVDSVLVSTIPAEATTGSYIHPMTVYLGSTDSAVIIDYIRWTTSV